VSVQIIQATLADAVVLQNISMQTFFEAFADDNSEADMQLYLTEQLSIEKLTIELENEHAQFYFALQNNTIIAYLKINTGPAQNEFVSHSALELERIYVLKEFYKKGIGQLLLNKVFEIASAQNLSTVWLGVWEHNTRAINFYEKNGFVPFGKHKFMLGMDRQTDVLMKREL
jgi:diamine N-acetyltransferase